MMRTQKTDIIGRSAPLLLPYRADVSVGDFAPDFEALDASGRKFRLFEDAFAGQPLVLVIADRIDRDDVRNQLAAWAAAEADIETLGARLVVVTTCTYSPLLRSFAREFGLQAPVVGDGNGVLLARYGLVRGIDLQSPETSRVFIITPLGQIRSIMTEPTDTVAAGLATLKSLSGEAAMKADAGWIPGHAPILVIPNVLEAEDCRELIDRYEGSDGFRVAKPAPGDASGDYKFAVSDYNRQDRIDHVIQDPELLARLDRRIQERVVPQVLKAFAFQVTRRESLHIARYSGPRDGIEVGHRDNQHPTSAYRRFALSIALNEDYEGGELTFREYAGRGYRGATGTAFVFSSSLLHEIEETTSGVRYNLISHFFNEASLQQSKR
ncbi:redoxin domain-containing protein [Maricaulis sp.]|uniref:redoxin domain-containing protein n=1 Tax=Maricaulis sp. TaxID=1486257 RepID=UPI003298417F